MIVGANRPRWAIVFALTLSCTGQSAVTSEPARLAPARPAVRTTAASSEPALSFAIRNGTTDNRFFRQGGVAAHVLATAGDVPRIIVAFPAGNTGTGLWFDGVADRMSIDEDLSAIERTDGMRGVTATIRARASRLRVKTALLGSIRVLREYSQHREVPAEFTKSTIVSGKPIVFQRATVDGEHRLELALEATSGAVEVDAEGLVLVPGPSGEIVTRVTALSDEKPLTAVSADRILNPAAADDPRARSALTFLTFDEKILAGSWQYLSYFGRDTLLSTRLLMPVLRPAVIEAALGAVIERLSPDGEVAHEESIGEWASLGNFARKPRPANVRQPSYDYKMIDDDFLLAPVLDSYLDTAEGVSRAQAFFQRRTSAGRTFGEMVRKNLERVTALAVPFAERPTYQNLIRIGDGLAVGNWRDSEEGLGGGRIPYDVNAALVPAALRAASRLYENDAFGKDEGAALQARDLAHAWQSAEPMFRVTIGADEARQRVKAYGVEQKLDVEDAVASIDGPVSFPALSLDGNGLTVPVLHTDEGFVMMFCEPSASWLVSAASRIVRPFPAGLRTPVGIVVANPAYATRPGLRDTFTRDHYHGTVVWSWQQALLLSGLRRQLARTDLDSATRHVVADAEQALASVTEATRSQRTSELWSFSVDKQGYHVVPFGQAKGHLSEANSVQLWSTVFLALDGRR